MQSEPVRNLFKSVVRFFLRLVSAGLLAYLGAGGICEATDFLAWRSSDYVCGHNTALTFGLLFVVIWALLEFALPVFFRGRLHVEASGKE
jgi:hypothetical protein